MVLDEKLMFDLFSIEFLGNSLQNILFAVLLFFIFKVFLKQIIIRIIKRLESVTNKTKIRIDNYFIDVLANIHPRFYDFLSFYFAIKTLILSIHLEKVLDGLLIGIVILQVINSLNNLSTYLLKKLFNLDHISEEDRTVFDGFTLLIKIILWITGLLFLLANLGVNISSLAASLGIGGIAIALAVQNILGDLFSSFSIYFDKPFAVGDTIIVDKYTGVVKRIGLKSTRIQTLQGEELIIGNKELISSKIQNLKKMERRRVMFSIGLSCDISVEQLKIAKEIITKAILDSEKVELERVNFFEFLNNGLILEVVYFHKNADALEYLNERELINLKIKEGFDKENIHFANPVNKSITGT
jgi:small-conductance mechanosensitive channel